jgi:hypothetical protein
MRGTPTDGGGAGGDDPDPPTPPHSGGDPEGLGWCTDCLKIYPVQRTEGGLLRPIGTGGTCRCGGTEFERYAPAPAFETD